MQVPAARGPLSERVFAALRTGEAPGRVPSVDCADPAADEDVQITLWTCFELHYRGFDEVDAGREWDPALIALRRELEDPMLAQLRREVEVPPSAEPVPQRLRDLVDDDGGPQLSMYLQRRATRAQFEEFAVHRSIYQLKEADPHSWAIPRLRGAAKAALVEIQAGEYGAGIPERMHSELFARTLRGLGLDDTYGGYVDAVPAITLATSNLISLFGLRRELRGALAGHLAAFEMTSSAPNRRYSRGLQRLGADELTRRFYDEHVTADALHEQLAAYDLCGNLAADEPELTEDILFGAAACLHVDGRFAAHLLQHWNSGRTSLRETSEPVRADVS